VNEIDDYLARVPEPARGTLNKLRGAIRACLPAETTEGFSYRIPAFLYQGKPVAGFAAFARHCSYFPMSGAVVGQLEKELAGYAVSKGTIRFPIDKPLPAALVKKLVKARLAELAGKEQAPRSRIS